MQRWIEIPYVPAKADLNAPAKSAEEIAILSAQADDKFSKKKLAALRINTQHKIVKAGSGLFELALKCETLCTNNATVWLARHLLTNSWAAVKIESEQQTPLTTISSHHLQAKKQRERHLLQHLSLLQGTINRKAKNKGSQYIHIIPLVRGYNLKEFSESGRELPLILWLELAIGICEATQNLHAQLLLHRDIKPTNFMYDPSTRRVALIDFGFACQLPNADPDATFITSGRSGTPYYMAPEYRDKRENSKKADIYSVGATLTSLLKLGHLERTQGQMAMTLFAETNNALIKNSIIKNLNVRKQLSQYFARILATDPEQRPNLDEIIYFLRDLANTLSLTEKTITVGIMDVAVYEVSDETTKKRMHEDMQRCDEVVLMDSKLERSQPTLFYRRKAQEFSRVVLRNQVAVGIDNALADIMQAITSEPCTLAKHYQFIYITPTACNPLLKNP